MSPQLFEFRQKVSRSGYFWVKSIAGEAVERATPSAEWFDFEYYFSGPPILAPDEASTFYLATLAGDWTDASVHEKDVGQHLNLFLKFASTPLTAEAIIKFANDWGYLTGQLERLRLDGLLPVGEPIFHWVSAVHRFRRICALWELICRNDQNGLAKWVKWTGKSVVRCGHYVVAALDVFPERLEKMQPGDLLEPARYYIQDGVTRFKLGGMPNLSSHLIWDSELKEWRIQLTLTNLIGALSFQMATAICNKSIFRRCTGCGQWLQIAPGSGRPEKTYCSNACRMRAYRKRKAANKPGKTTVS